MINKIDMYLTMLNSNLISKYRELNELEKYWHSKQLLGKFYIIKNYSLRYLIIACIVLFFGFNAYNIEFSSIIPVLTLTSGISISSILLGTITYHYKIHKKKKQLNKYFYIPKVKTEIDKNTEEIKCIMKKININDSIFPYVIPRQELDKIINKITIPNEITLKGAKDSMKELEAKLETKYVEINTISSKKFLYEYYTELLNNKIYLSNSFAKTFNIGLNFLLFTSLCLYLLNLMLPNQLFNSLNPNLISFIGGAFGGILGNTICDKAFNKKIDAFNKINTNFKENKIDTKMNIDEIYIAIDKLNEEIDTKIMETIPLIASIVIYQETANKLIAQQKPKFSYERKHTKVPIKGTMLDSTDIEFSGNIEYSPRVSTSLIRKRIKAKELPWGYTDKY